MDVKPLTAHPDAEQLEAFCAEVERALLVAALMEVSLARIVKAFDLRNYDAFVSALDAGRDILARHGDYTRPEQAH